MKKIVALVLALVLALSLATVAFAADETGYFAAKEGSLIKLEKATLEKVKDAGEKNVAVYAVNFTVNGKQFPLAAKFAVASEADYEYVFVKGDKVTYLKQTYTGEYTGTAALTKVAAKADAVCGDIVPADGVTLYDYDGKIMKAVDSLTFKTVAKNVAADVKTELLGDIVGFTKENWDIAYKYVLANKAVDMGVIGEVTLLPTKTAFGEPVRGGYIDNELASHNYLKALTKFLQLVYVQALHDFGSDRGTRIQWTADNLKVVTKLATDIYNKFGFMGPLDEDGEHSATPTDWNGSLLKQFLTEAKDNIIDLIDTHMPWYDGSKDPTIPSDADFNGNFPVALARAILKPALTTKAVALVDGVLVPLADAVEDVDYTVTAHTYAADFEMVDGKLTVAKVYCEDCDKVFDFVIGSKADAEKAFGTEYKDITNAFKYKFTTKFLGKPDVSFNWDTMAYDASWKDGKVYGWDLLEKSSRCMMFALDGKQLYISTAVAAAEVESAKTFDAGIALYAGMALMSVTGSAIVIGKKKEF